MNPQDPLISTEAIVTKYDDFVDYAIQILQEEQQQEHGISQEQQEEVKLQRRIDVVEKLNQLAADLHELQRNTYGEMARLQAVAADGGSSAARYALRDELIPFVFGRLGNINTHLEVSTSLVDELRGAKEQLSVLMALVQVVRQGEIHQ